MNALVLYSVLVFLTSAIGGLLPLFFVRLSENALKIFVAFGAGLLLGMAFLHMVPESAEMLPHEFGLWFLLGFLILLVLERFIMVHACEEHGCDYHTIGLAAFAGLTIHGVIEGLALASSLLVSNIGFMVLLGILAHKAPAGFALTSILRLGGKSPKQIAAFVIGVSLSGPLGVLVAYFLLNKAHEHNLAGILLALSAGTFLYIGACDLLPELHRTNTDRVKRLIAFLFGLFLCFISGKLVSH